MNSESVKTLYKNYTGQMPEEIEKLPLSGSNRQYFRLKGTKQLIGVYGASTQENNAFVYLANHFANKGISVPRVYAVSGDRKAYLQDDLGTVTLFDAIAAGRQCGQFNDTEMHLLKETIRQLPRIQFEGSKGLDFKQCFPQSQFDRRCILWDLHYFKYCFLKAIPIDFDENRLEDDFEQMERILLTDSFSTFMYRDFQSRNVMICNGHPFFIDFQGGRKGPIYYDLASFLWQAKANFPPNLREELIREYVKSASTYEILPPYFNERLQHFVLFRTLQVLGAYGFRGYFEKKSHFLQSIPYAIKNLKQLLQQRFPEYPYLCKLLHQITDLPLFNNTPQENGLTVRITSFSYKKGIPGDPSGNGGGYVFDCRAIHNPGKYEAYKQLTGRDDAVIRFLEKDGEILTFLEHVYALADAHIQRYLERGFTHLDIHFGCTGGQHRSVYAAEHVAKHVHERFNVRVLLIHREQQIEETINPCHL